MKNNLKIKKMLQHGFVLCSLIAVSSQVSALTVNLCTGVTTKTMPDTTVVTMWGFGTDTTGTGACVATVPGPEIVVPVLDTNLTINLRNTLVGEAVSVMIPGLTATTVSAPVMTATNRVRSFTHETAPATTGIYSFNVTPGTYLYQSGTHIAKQIQMGLYGAAVNDSVAGSAYPGVTYDKSITLLYSEIDPALHNAVATNIYGSAAYSSTINYAPKYFLVNGEAYSPTTAKINGGLAGSTILLRLLNAGLESHVPVVNGHVVNVIAEYGKQYSYARRQHTVLLAAGQTRDVTMTAPAVAGDFVIYDRRMRLTNNAQPGPGGFYSVVSVGVAAPVPNVAPIAGNDGPFDVNQGATISIAIADLLVNDNDPDGGPLALTISGNTQASNGSVSLDAATASFIYIQTTAGFSGPDSFTYTITDGASNSNAATITLNVIAPVAPPPVVPPTPPPAPPVAIAPLAVADPTLATDPAYTVAEDATTGVTIDVLLNDTAGTSAIAPATIAITQGNSGTATVVLGKVVYTPTVANFNGLDSFSYTVADTAVPANISNLATVRVEITPVNDAPVAIPDGFTGTTGIPLTFSSADLLSNDTDIDSDITLGSIATATTPLPAGLSVDPITGIFTYDPLTAGTVTFSYFAVDAQGAQSAATALVTLTMSNAPIALADTYSVATNTTLTVPSTVAGVVTVSVLANDTGTGILTAELDAASLLIPGLAFSADGSFSYIGGATAGVVTFAYTAIDSLGARSALTTVTINVGP